MTLTTTVDGEGSLFRVWRIMARLSEKRLAEKVNEELPRSQHVSRATINRYERGEVSAVNPLVLAAITKVTGHKVSELPESTQRDISLAHEVSRSTCCAGAIQRAA